MRGLMQERPLLIVVLSHAGSLDRQELLDFYAGKVAKWMAPDDVVIVEELPHTATGKLMKRALREAYSDYLVKDGRNAESRET